jgi:hypothetical protein
MSKLPEMGRVLHEHNWHGLAEWARMLEELGNLSDNEIEQLINEKNRLSQTPSSQRDILGTTHHEACTSAAGGWVKSAECWKFWFGSHRSRALP